MRACGLATVDVALLKQASRLEGYSDSDDAVRFLWEILAEYDQADRARFLCFTWGRSRHPRTL